MRMRTNRLHPASALAGALLGSGCLLLLGMQMVGIQQSCVLTDEQCAILRRMTLVELPDGQGGTCKTIRFTGVNVQIVNGMGDDQRESGHAGIGGSGAHDDQLRRQSDHRLQRATRRWRRSYGLPQPGARNAQQLLRVRRHRGRLRETASTASTPPHWEAPTTTPMDCRRSSSAARTTTPPGSTPWSAGVQENQASGLGACVSGGRPQNSASGNVVGRIRREHQPGFGDQRERSAAGRTTSPRATVPRSARRPARLRRRRRFLHLRRRAERGSRRRRMDRRGGRNNRGARALGQRCRRPEQHRRRTVRRGARRPRQPGARRALDHRGRQSV